MRALTMPSYCTVLLDFRKSSRKKKQPFFSFQIRDDLLIRGLFPRMKALVSSRTSQKDFPTFGNLSDARLPPILRLPWPKIPDQSAGLLRDID
jgi:hypothetical protein